MEQLFSKIQQKRQYRFLLNVTKNDEQELVEIIQELKAKRSFTRAIRTGLRLFWSLRQGRTDILLEEFPWVKEQLQNPMLQLQAQLDRIETKIETVPAPVLASGMPPLLAGGENALTRQLTSLESKLLSRETANMSPLAIDVEEDERLNLTIQQAKTDQQIGWNLQLSMAKSNFGCTYLELPLEALEYGLAQGDFGVTPEIIAQKRAKLAEKVAKSAPKKAISSTNVSARPLDEALSIDITAPDFDDLEVEW